QRWAAAAGAKPPDPEAGELLVEAYDRGTCRSEEVYEDSAYERCLLELGWFIDGFTAIAHVRPYDNAVSAALPDPRRARTALQTDGLPSHRPEVEVPAALAPPTDAALVVGAYDHAAFPSLRVGARSASGRRCAEARGRYRSARARAPP